VNFVENIDLEARADRSIANRVWEAASISMTSMCLLSMIALQCTPINGILMDGAAMEPSGSS
jgi:hypothetical protein